MTYKMLSWITLIIPFGLSASQANNSNLLKAESTGTIVAWLDNASAEVRNKPVGISAENNIKVDPVSDCIERMIEMQEKTAILYKAQNRMLEKLTQNQEILHNRLEALQEENKILKQRISDLEKHKNS